MWFVYVNRYTGVLREKRHSYGASCVCREAERRKEKYCEQDIQESRDNMTLNRVGGVIAQGWVEERRRGGGDHKEHHRQY